MKLISRIAASVAAAIALVSPLAAVPAQAATGNLVSFGDSFTANGGAFGDRYSESPALNFRLTPCLNDADNWPHRVAFDLGLDIVDYSCNGTSYWLDYYVNHAIAKGNINPDTEMVTFMYGGLQPDSFIDTLLSSAGSSEAPSRYASLLDSQFRKIREVAPNARIVMTNYPSMTVNDTACLYPPFGANIVIPGLTAAEAAWNRQIEDTAHRLGVEFVDVYSASLTHDPCQPDPAHRWTVLLQRLDSPSIMAGHPTDVGHAEMGAFIGRELLK